MNRQLRGAVPNNNAARCPAVSVRCKHNMLLYPHISILSQLPNCYRPMCLFPKLSANAWRRQEKAESLTSRTIVLVPRAIVVDTLINDHEKQTEPWVMTKLT